MLVRVGLLGSLLGSLLESKNDTVESDKEH